MDVLTIIVAVLALFISIFIAIRQSVDHKGSDSIDVVLNLFKEFREPSMVSSRHFVVDTLNTTDYLPEKGLYNLPDGLREQTLTVSHFFDHVGVLIAHRLIPRDAIIGFLGDSIITCWTVIRPFIIGERNLRGQPYQEYFQMLYEIAKHYPPQRIRLSLRKRNSWSEK